MLTVILVAAIVRAHQQTGNPEVPLAVMTLWSLGLVFVRACELRSTLYDAPDLESLAFLPIAPESVFRWELRKFVFASLWTLVELSLGYWIICGLTTTDIGSWLWATMLAGILWCVVLALAALLIAFLPWLPVEKISTHLYLGVLICLFGQRWISPKLFGFLNRSAPWLNLALPTGWTSTMFLPSFTGSGWQVLVLLIPIAGLVATLRLSLARLRRDYQFSEAVQDEPQDILPEFMEPYAAVTPQLPTREAKPPRRVGLTEIEEFVKTGGFLRVSDCSRRGWFERQLHQWLTPRERVVLELMFPDGPRISADWRRAVFIIPALAGLVAVVVRIFGEEFFWFACIIGALVGAGLLWQMLCDAGHAFGSCSTGGVNIPFYAGLPVSYRELARVLLKQTAVQFPALAALLMVSGVLVAFCLNHNALAGGEIGFKLAWLILALRPVFLIFQFSSGTNDSSRIRPAIFWFAPLILAEFGVLVALAVMGFVLPNPGWSGLCLAAVAPVSIAALASYGWFFRFGRFDLLQVPQE